MTKQLDIDFINIHEHENNVQSQQMLNDLSARWSGQCQRLWVALNKGEVTSQDSGVRLNIMDVRARIRDLKHSFKKKRGGVPDQREDRFTGPI